MLLAFSDLAVPGERAEQELVDARIEGRELEPLLEVRERLVVGGALDEVLQQGGVAAAESPALGREPPVEHRTAAHFETFQKLAAEQRGQRAWPIRREPPDAPARPASDLHPVRRGSPPGEP